MSLPAITALLLGMASILLHVLTTARGRAQSLASDRAVLGAAANLRLKVTNALREAENGPT